jgi:multidrug resistance efflux pump
VKVLKTKTFRVIFGCGLIIFSLYIISPYFVNFKSNEAIINSSINYVNSPLEGYVRYNELYQGMRFPKNGEVFRIHNLNQDRSTFYELETEKNALETRIEGLQSSINQINDEINFLNEKDINYHYFVKKKLQNQINVKKTIIENLTQKIELRNNSAFKNNKTLNDEDYLLNIQNELRLEKELLKGLEIDLMAAGKNVFIEIGRSEQNWTTSKNQQQSLMVQLNENIERKQSMEKQVNHELLKLTRTMMFSYRPNFNGVVWRSKITNDDYVFMNDELISVINCNNVFVDAIVSNNEAKSIRIGDPVSFRMVHELNNYIGKVINIGGSAIKTDNNSEAAAIKTEKSKHQSVVRISFDKEAVLKTNDNYDDKFCLVGNAVEVNFDRTIKRNTFKNFKKWITSVY